MGGRVQAVSLSSRLYWVKDFSQENSKEQLLPTSPWVGVSIGSGLCQQVQQQSFSVWLTRTSFSSVVSPVSSSHCCCNSPEWFPGDLCTHTSHSSLMVQIVSLLIYNSCWLFNRAQQRATPADFKWEFKVQNAEVPWKVVVIQASYCFTDVVQETCCCISLDYVHPHQEVKEVQASTYLIRSWKVDVVVNGWFLHGEILFHFHPWASKL